MPGREEKTCSDINMRYIEMAVEKYGKMLFRICFNILANREDAEDAVQETFLKYMTNPPSFNSDEHEKAWLIKVATNTSKNIGRFRLRHADLCLDDIEDIGVSPDDTGIFEAIMSLPAKYKTVLDLHYIEGYTANEISEITGVRPDAVRKRLQTGRNRLKKEMERNLNGNDI